MRKTRLIFLILCFLYLSFFGYQYLDVILKSYKFYESEALVFILPAILTLYLIFKNNQILDSDKYIRHSWSQQGIINKKWEKREHIGMGSFIIYLSLFTYALLIGTFGMVSAASAEDDVPFLVFISTIFLMPALVRSTYFWKVRVRKRQLKEGQAAEEKKKQEIREAVEKENAEFQEKTRKKNQKLKQEGILKKYGKEVSSAYRKDEICIGMPFSLVKEVLGQEYERKRTAKFTRYKFGRFYTREYDTKLEIDLTKVVNPFDISKKRLHYRFQVDFKDELCVDWEELDHPSNPEYSNRRITHK